MPSINNLNVQVNQNLVDQNQLSQTGTGQIGQAGATRPIPQALPGIRTGTMVEGQVLAQNADGTYSVRVDAQGMPQELRARATLSLMVGERFRAVWDASGNDGVPVLRLSQGELSFLSQIPRRDRELATSLLARGLPLSNEVLSTIKDAWRRMGSRADQLSPLIELWARGVPMNEQNVSLLAQYAALDGAAATAMWDRIRKGLKARTRKGENPIDALRGMKEGDGDEARFLQAHSILMRAPREEVNPALLAAPFWPVQDDASHLTARVFAGRSASEEGQRYWQVGFGVAGSSLGFIGGIVESDGRGCNVNLHAESLEACALMEERRGEMRAELEGTALPVRFIGISRNLVEGLRDRLLAGRGLDVTV